MSEENFNNLCSKSNKKNKTDRLKNIQISEITKTSYKQPKWSENTEQGTHSWSDVTNTHDNESCYLSDPNTLKFHKLIGSVKCVNESKNCDVKRCNICKITVHESCIHLIEKYVKCKVTFIELTNERKKFKNNELDKLRSLNNKINLHHWLCHKYDEESCGNKCQGCLESFKNRSDMQTNASIVRCSWCKASYHLKCFSQSQLSLECNLSEHNQLVVPPDWILKSANINLNYPIVNDNQLFSTNNNYLSTKIYSFNTTINNNKRKNSLSSTSSSSSSQNQGSTDYLNSLFSIRPPLYDGSYQNWSNKTPLLVLINPKSGGKLGLRVIEKFNSLLNPRQVFDLTQCGGPKIPLYLFRNVPNLRVLVGGGDGTIGWVLSCMDQIKFVESAPPVALLPLGTGNDFSRLLNWGNGYRDEPLTKVLSKVSESKTVKLDRWKISVEPNMEKIEYFKPYLTNTLKCDEMNHSFSIGADANMFLQFHQRREANPQKFSSRSFNLLQYTWAGYTDQFKNTCRGLTDHIQLECDGKNFTDLIKSRRFHCIIFFNISKYCCGRNPWGNSKDPNFKPQAIDDGLIEVIGCFTTSLALFYLGGHGERICQAKHVKLTTNKSIPVQIDGEPTKLNPSLIEITHKNQSLMLKHVTNSSRLE